MKKLYQSTSFGPVLIIFNCFSIVFLLSHFIFNYFFHFYPLFVGGPPCHGHGVSQVSITDLPQRGPASNSPQTKLSPQHKRITDIMGGEQVGSCERKLLSLSSSFIFFLVYICLYLSLHFLSFFLSKPISFFTSLPIYLSIYLDTCCFIILYDLTLFTNFILILGCNFYNMRKNGPFHLS